MSLNSMLACLCGRSDPDELEDYPRSLDNEKKPLVELVPASGCEDNRLPSPKQNADEQTAAKIVAILRDTDKIGAALKAELDSVAPVSASGWSEWLAESIFHALRSILGDNFDEKETKWGVALTEAYQTARAVVEDQFSDLVQYVTEHPGEAAARVGVEILLSLLAFGILVRVTRWVVTLLGFGEMGPIAGSFAAKWEARYAGFIPKGSLFSYIQRMGMTWK
ncbi:unnamed protein product [Discula destructiva]